MGRIADALKRAEHERTQRAHAEDVSGRLHPAQDGADLLADAIVEAPPLPRTLLAHAAPLTGDVVDERVVVIRDATSHIAERYRSLRTRLMTSNPAGHARCVAVTSSLPGEGKTVTVANLGFSLAELRHLRVGMIDLDLRQRGLSRLFHVADRPGVAEVLRGEHGLADVCLSLVRGNLYLVPAGNPHGASPSELLAGPRAAALFREMNERFHHNLIDCPPVSTVADIGLIAPLCHSVLIVIRMHSTPEPVVRRSVKMLQANHVPILGCILAGSRDEGLAGSDSHHHEQIEP